MHTIQTTQEVTLARCEFYPLHDFHFSCYSYSCSFTSILLFLLLFSIAPFLLFKCCCNTIMFSFTGRVVDHTGSATATLCTVWYSHTVHHHQVYSTINTQYVWIDALSQFSLLDFYSSIIRSNRASAIDFYLLLSYFSRRFSFILPLNAQWQCYELQ